jgi:hypothetical protein
MGRVCVSMFPLGLLLAAGCAPVVDAKFSDIEVTRPDIPIPPAGPGGTSSLPVTFSFDSTFLGANSNLEAQSQIVAVDMNKLSLTAKTGVTDLSFIRTLHALAYVPLKNSYLLSGQSSRQVEIADYERRSDTEVGPTFSVPLPEPVDILSLMQPSSLDQRKIVVVVSLGGQLPNQNWTIDVSMSISVELKQ